MGKTVLIINPILYTPENDHIPRVDSIRDTMIISLCMGFIENGDVPVLIAAEEYRPLSDEDYPFDIVWFKSESPGIFKPRCLPKLKGLYHYLKQNGDRFDYIISSEAFSLCTLSVAKCCKDKLIIWHELGAHNNLFHKLPSKFWYNIVARIMFKNVLVIPRSQHARQFIHRFCNRVSDITVDHGVNLSKFQATREKEAFFVVVSQLVKRKNIDKIIEAFNIPGYKLLIIGDGSEKADLERQAALYRARDIEFLGKMNHQELIPILMRAMGLLIYTQKDNSMVSIVESIACGTPVLTTTVPFNSSYIKKYDLGLVKDEWGINELKELISNNPMYVDNCIKYREKVSTRYMAQQFNTAAKELVSENYYD